MCRAAVFIGHPSSTDSQLNHIAFKWNCVGHSMEDALFNRGSQCENSIAELKFWDWPFGFEIKVQSMLKSFKLNSLLLNKFESHKHINKLNTSTAAVLVSVKHS